MAFRVSAPRTCCRTLAAKPVARRVVKLQAGKEVAISYANALVDLAKEKDLLEAVHTDVAGLEAMLKSDDALKTFICNPVITSEKKGKVIDSVAKEAGFQVITANFLKLLVDRQRMDNIEAIIAQFEEKYCQLTNTQVAYLRSAVKLEQEQQFLVAKKLQEVTGSKNIKLKPVIDESLIAGFIVEYGSSQIDLSIKGALDRINNDLMVAVASA